MNSVWSGHIAFGLISLPVKLYSGARSASLSFNMLHREDLSRLKQQYVCQADGKVVEKSEIVKGYEYEKDCYLVVEPEEIKKLEPETAHTMDIQEFVRLEEIDPVYFESSYYVMPEDAGLRPYALLAKTLEACEMVGIAHLAMHNREYTVFLRSHKGGLMLHTMYYREEVRELEGFGAPAVELHLAELQTARQFLNALVTDWRPERYKDEFQERMKRLITTKLTGEAMAEPEKPQKREPVSDLVFAMRQSIAAAKKKQKTA
jgi:DNA end-binding protein Ku